MKRSFVALLLAACAAGPVLAQEDAAPSVPVVALVGGTVVDVAKGTKIADATVLVQGERIVRVGASGTLAVPAGATVVPMRGQWLIPGLMNMHVHLGLKLPGAQGNALLNETDPEEVLRMARTMRAAPCSPASPPCASPARTMAPTSPSSVRSTAARCPARGSRPPAR